MAVDDCDGPATPAAPLFTVAVDDKRIGRARAPLFISVAVDDAPLFTVAVDDSHPTETRSPPYGR